MNDPFKVPSGHFPGSLEEKRKYPVIRTENITFDLLREAYWNGYFPWPDNNSGIPWVAPPERGLIPMDRFHVPHTVKRMIKKGTFELRIDTVFEEVIHHCSNRKDDETWITPEVISAYTEFHREGWAHSFEAWNRETGTLAGGLYGVSIGQLFAGESMFFRETGASKFALAMLGTVLSELGVKLLDTQMVTPTTELFGAEYYSGEEYLECVPYLRGKPFSTQQLRDAAEKLRICYAEK